MVPPAGLGDCYVRLDQLSNIFQKPQWLHLQKLCESGMEVVSIQEIYCQ